MNNEKFELEFITPAFLSGANQKQAELRAPSIRGQLRWWYRVLGGNANEESTLFGGVCGDAKSSKIIVRVVNVNAKHQVLPSFSPMSDLGYIYYFASVSGKDKGIKRTEQNSHFAPGTSFEVEFIERNPLTESEHNKLWLAVDAMWRLGSLGLRTTRGCGAIADVNAITSLSDFKLWLNKLPKTLFFGVTVRDTIYENWSKCQEALGGFLRDFRKSNRISSNQQSALGFSSGNKRASSSLLLRPVKLKEGFLPLIIYTDANTTQTSILDHLIKYSI